MKKTSSASITARVTLGAVLLLSGIALICVGPLTSSYGANAKRNARTVSREKPAAIITPNLPNTGPTPASGTVNASNTQTASWDGTTISPGGNQNTDTTCMDNSSVLGCETFTLTVIGTQADWAGKKIQVLLTWTSVANEYDIHIHKGSNAGPLLTSAFQGPGLLNQVAFIDPANLPTTGVNPTTVFTVHVAYDTTPASATDEYHGSATAVPLSTTSIAAAPPDTGPKIGFENFEAPGVLQPGTALSSGGVTVEYLGRGAGEPSIGANWVTGVVNFQSDLQTEFVTFNDSCNLSNPKAIWVNRRAPTSNFIDSDPIGFTDHTSGTANRVFAAELTLLSPDTVKISHTDDDGVTWVPDQSGGLASAVDHETIGGGPYNANAVPPPPPHPLYPNAIYYASQDIAFASMSRSDDGGSTYGPSVHMYTINQCSGLHGHIKVAPDGTVYVPNRACGNVPILNGGNTAVVVSTDNGLTWAIRPVLNGSVPSSSATDDPAVAVDTAGKTYCLFALNGTNAAVGISEDKGVTWKNIYDVGAGFGLTNVAFPAAIGGDAGRAAVAFYASKAGNGGSSADGYTGVWHLYVAETFDGGDHWTTTDVTPSLPMQRMGLLRGGGGPVDRNLLDFFDMTADKDGRVLVGYVNGCSGGDCSQAPVNPDGSTTATGNTWSATASIARQSSGRRLSGTQPNATSVPGMPFVTQRRVGPVVHLAWNAADPGYNGTNQTITNFQILRGTTSGGENPTPIATVAGNVNKLDDTTAVDPTVTYYYKVIATNTIGSSCANNEIAAPFVGDTCSGMIIHRNLPSHPEATGGSVGGVPVGPTPTPTATPAATPPIPTQYLIDYIAVAEPPSQPGKFLFQMKVIDLSSVPANSRWRMVWNSVSTPNEQYYVGMTTDANSVVTFEYGTVLTQSIPPVVGVIGLPTEEPVGTPDAASNFNADGTISIYVNKSLVGNPQPGDILGAVNGRTFNTGDTPPNTFQRSSLLIDHTFIKGNTDTSFPPATYTVVGNTSCPAAAIVPVGAVSRKTHGAAGTYDIDLPLIGAPGIECRTGGPSGNHKVVVTFAHPVTIGGSTTPPPSAVTLNGTGGSVSSITVNSSEVTINLTGVANAQNLGITLNTVSDGMNSGNVSITMGVLEGDTTGNGKVNSSDISQTQSQSGQQVTLSNFREDVTVNGFINSSDISVVQSRSGTALP